MDIYRELSGFYEDVIREEANRLIPAAVEKVISGLSEYKIDSGRMKNGSGILENIWDEICVQAQQKRSEYWNSYAQLMDDVCTEILEKNFTRTQVKIIGLQNDRIYCWFNTDDGEGTVDDGERSYEIRDGQGLKDVLMHYAVQVVESRVLDTAAGYTNGRIEKFIAEGCEI